MSQPRQRSVDQQLLFTFGTLCAILAIIGGLLFFSLRSIERSSKEKLSYVVDEAELVAAAGQNVGLMQAVIFRHILGPDPAETKQRDQTIHEIDEANAETLAAYQKFVDSKEEGRLYAGVLQARKEYMIMTEQLLTISRANHDVETRAFAMSQQVPAYEQYQKAIKDMTGYVNNEVREIAIALDHRIAQIRMICDLFVLIAILIAIGTGFTVTRVARRLKGDNDALQTEIKERAQAEAELRRKTAFLEAQVNTSIDGILVVDPEGKKVLQNRRTAELFKIPPAISDANDDAAQVRWVTSMTKNPEQFVEKVHYLYSHPAEISCDEIELKDGTILDRYSSPVVDQDGKCYGRIWTFHDITERKRAENELRESSEKFHHLADNITDAFWIRSADMREVHYVSPAFERIWGRSVESLYVNPQLWVDFILPEDRERVQAAFTALAGDSPSLDIQYRILRPDGEIRWIRVRGFQVRDAAGKLIRHTGIVTDITEHKQAEDALRESEERFSGAFEYAPIGVGLASPDGRWLKVNRVLCDLVGYSESDLLTRTFQDITHPDDIQISLENLRRTLTGERRSFQVEKRYVHQRGHFITALTNVSLVRDGEDQPRYFVAQVQDVTERKRLEAQLVQSQKMETVGKLAGGVAHEFNSIMTAIIGQSELLLHDLPPDNPLGKSAAEIRKAADRAATLTRQLLAYGRKQILQPEILDLNSVLAGMEGTLRHLVGQGVNVSITPAAGLKAVKADVGQVEQVIMNMAINAIDAMPNGGKLILETASVTFDEHSVGRYSELKPGDYVMLAITDTGTGMNEEVKTRVFEPFFTTKAVGQGTGLGLSTCYGIIKQSGGHISVYSELARGATFKIYLPQVEPQARIPVLRPYSPALPRGTETILLVEDDPALREMAATLLRRLGYTVLAAANGIEALNLKQQPGIGHVDLLFTDVVMPHMSGKELSERVRALYPHTKILFTSAYTENAIIHQGVLHEGLMLLQKPFTPAALAYKLRQVLDQPATLKPDTTQKTFAFT